MSKYLFTYLLVFTLILGEVHTYWEKKPIRNENWIINNSVPMSIQWNVKLATDQAWYIIVFTSMLFYKPNRVNKATVPAFICFAVIDTLFYFWNYKTYGYGYTYLFVAGIWLILYNWHRLTFWK